MAEDRNFGIDLERAVFLTVLHRLFDSRFGRYPIAPTLSRHGLAR
jgi:hypothetical protein